MGDVETLARGEDSRLVEARRFLIRDRQAFNAVWVAHAGPNAAVPVVDFESRMVAAVFAGERPTAGFSIEVTGTRREGSQLVIAVDERQPDPTQVAAQVIVSPFHIVTLPRDDGDIRFSLPDPGGSHTIIFKAPARSIVKPAPSSSSSLSAEAWRAGDDSSMAVGGEASPFTGLTPQVAASLAYLAGPFSGALLLATEPASHFVRFHAWQAVIGLGTLGIAAVSFLGLAFVLLIVSPTAFWAMLWLSAATSAVWLVIWVLCVVNAYKGRVMKLPIAGAYAARKHSAFRIAPVA